MSAVEREGWKEHREQIGQREGDGKQEERKKQMGGVEKEGVAGSRRGGEL